MTCFVNLDAHELHPMNEKVFNDFMMNAKVLHFTYDRVDCYLKIHLHTYVDDYIRM